MALWGNNDNRDAQGTVTLNYATGIVTGSNLEDPGNGTLFGEAGSIQEGDVIRFGVMEKPGTYMGDAVVVSIASTTQLTIGSTAGLSGVAIAATTFQGSQLPKYTIKDSHYSETQSGYSANVYGISTAGAQDANGATYEVGVGWVGVTTYIDTHGNLRVKKEILVAMSGIETGNTPSYPNIEDAV
jgi:hypothetical protein|tara:strand:- start:2694 stop:3248 length:555 start_codon:yes stop_codon:yes gene_type:complete